MKLLQLPILAVFLAVALLVIAKDASANHVQRVIVEHHYPQGVTQHGNGHNRHYHNGGHYGASTCYRECYHQGVNPGHHRPRHSQRHGGHRRGSSVQFGISVGGRGHHGYQSFSFGFSQRR